PRGSPAIGGTSPSKRSTARCSSHAARSGNACRRSWRAASSTPSNASWSGGTERIEAAADPTSPLDVVHLGVLIHGTGEHEQQIGQAGDGTGGHGNERRAQTEEAARRAAAGGGRGRQPPRRPRAPRRGAKTAGRARGPLARRQRP